MIHCSALSKLKSIMAQGSHGSSGSGHGIGHSWHRAILAQGNLGTRQLCEKHLKQFKCKLILSNGTITKESCN